MVVGISLILFPATEGASKRLGPMIEARQKFFGAANVDPRTGEVRSDRVILSWFGVAGYAASFNGHVVLADAWVPRGSHSGYVPTTLDEVASLRPEYIFIGHGDFDHAADAAEIAATSGATIVGTPEHCRAIKDRAPEGSDIFCERVGPEGAPPGFAKELALIPGVGITAVVHIHSSFESPEYQDGGRLPCIPIWNAQDTVDHPPTPEDLAHLLRHLPDARGGNVLYQFRVGRFALAWHDTTGKLQEDAPLVIEALRALPPTDVHFGAILAFGQVTNCFRSLRMYLDALAPRVFAATHHDNFTYAIGANAEDLEPYVREELARIPKRDRPELLYSYDRADYIKPALFTFDPTDPRWR
jgi:hypothetical protein